MKIIYDHQAYTYQDYGGVSRYYAEIIDVLKKEEDVSVYLPIIYSNNRNLIEKSTTKYYRFFDGYSIKGKYHFMNAINSCNSLFRLKTSEYDIFHPTYYDNYFLNFIKKPFVVTVYDMIHEIYPEMFAKHDKTAFNKKKLVERATYIFSISQATKKDLIKYYNINEDKILVTPLSSSLAKDTFLDVVLPEKYILFVGNRVGYKNFDRFIKAIKEILLSDKELYLVCAGGGPFNKFEIIFLKENKVFNKVKYHSIKENNLYHFYKNASVFVFPSLYEGFGIPTLEAFESGCPCLLSNTSSFPEVGANAALYFDPHDISSIRNKVIDVLYDKQLATDLTKSGFDRRNDFSWEKTAKLTAETYRKIYQS